MNIDLYDLNVVATAEGSTSNEPASTNNLPFDSLNEEVTQMFSQLGRFWGGVRKQSQTALESARKDLGQAVSQAQKEIEKQFTTATHASPEAPISDELNSTPTDDNEANAEAVQSNPQSESVTPSATTFFSRLQSSLPPNIRPASFSRTLQRHLPENLQSGLNLERATADFAQLRATLVENIQRVQSETTLHQAEKLAEQYLQKGEALFKEAGEFLKDAVKVLPPEEGDALGVVWDGTDVWPMPPVTPPSTARKGKEKEGRTLSAPHSLGKRKEVLLRKLHTSPDEIRRDPEEENDVAIKELWSSFTKEVEDAGTIEGKVWSDKIEAVTQNDNEDIKELLNLHKQLVPSEMSNETFWTRYFFRIDRIQQEEERRKALLEGTSQQFEDQDGFTWEDEEEEEEEESAAKGSIGRSSIADEVTSSVPTLVPTPSPLNSGLTQTPSVSPRRSEDSYDVVSSTVSSTGQKNPETNQKVNDAGESDESDWE